MDNNIKDMIKIPKELDNAILKGFEKGKREKKRAKQKVIFKRSAIAAGIIVAGTTMAGMINPELVSAIPIVGDVFEYFNDGVYKQASDKYEELGKDVNVTIEDNGVRKDKYLLYKHTHTLNSKEMARLIDGTVQDAKQLGIETKTPQQLAEMKSLWRTAK